MKVIKRDGRKVEYDKSKIYNAIKEAMKDLNEVNEIKLTKVVNEVHDNIKNKDIEVEAIQDLVENALMNNGLNKVAKNYILYRKARERIRQSKTSLMKEISEKVRAANVQNQNANVDEHSFGGRMGEANRAVMKDYALNNCVSKMARENHLNNEVYIHDLDSYAVGMHNCLSIPFDKILAKGFNTRQTDVRPANSVNTAFQLVAVIFQLQSLQQFGGVSSTHLDWTMVPYVRKSFRKHYIDGLKYIEGIDVKKLDYQLQDDLSIEDEEYKLYPKVYNFAMDMTVKETKQAVEGMYHNLNY